MDSNNDNHISPNLQMRLWDAQLPFDLVELERGIVSTCIFKLLSSPTSKLFGPIFGLHNEILLGIYGLQSRKDVLSDPLQKKLAEGCCRQGASWWQGPRLTWPALYPWPSTVVTYSRHLVLIGDANICCLVLTFILEFWRHWVLPPEALVGSCPSAASCV